MAKLSKHNTKRNNCVKRMNDAAVEYEDAKKRHEKAVAELASVEVEVKDQEIKIRAEVERMFAERMDEEMKKLSAAKSEAGVARKLVNDARSRWESAREQLLSVIPHIDIGDDEEE
jgi:hypothetical protein